MIETARHAMTTPGTWDETPMPKRNGHKGMLPSTWLNREQGRGASYKRLAAIAHTVGMSAEERSGWYSVCRSIPLSDRHAGHILSKLKRRRGGVMEAKEGTGACT